MKPSSDVTGLYRSFPAYLWVEDEETRTYLETAWSGESYIKVYVAGGHKHLQAVVNAARNDGNTHVFGFRDRDFGTSNRSRWGDHTLTVLTSDVLELENLLLDADAIASCTVNASGLDAAQIELRAAAAPMPWWMSCRRTITEMGDAVLDHFPAHPACGVITSQRDAEDAIFNSTWWTNVLPSLHAIWGNRGTVTGQLLRHEASYRAMLTSGAWKQEFSGKEILQPLLSKVWTRKRPAGAEARTELVRAIAEAQRVRKQIPQEISDLRTAIRGRIGH